MKRACFFISTFILLVSCLVPITQILSWQDAFCIAELDESGKPKHIMDIEHERMRTLIGQTNEKQDDCRKEYIKWCQFDVPYDALVRAMNIDIKTKNNLSEGQSHVDWIELLTLVAVKCYGNFKNYRSKDLEAIALAIKNNEDLSKYKNAKYYNFYKQVYTTVLKEYLGYRDVVKKDVNDPQKTIVESVYGLKVFSPIARGYGFSHYADFGANRSFGYKRRHLGHDLLGSIGTPIMAVEGGVVVEVGWNRYGGWRIGIRSHDGNRFYYYAHLRKDKPYSKEYKIGDQIQAGEHIGYLGMTGYSSKPNTNNINKPHLHFGIQLIFDESQLNGSNQIWIDPYAIIQLLNKSRASI